MSMSSMFALLAAVCGGMAVALQAPINAALAGGLKSSIGAAAVSFGVGFCVLMLILLVIGDMPSLGKLGGVNPVLLVGGVLGAFYVWSIVWSVPTLGVLTAISAVVLGQLAAALILDAIGPFGLPAIEITWQRIVGILLVVSGLVLTKV